ncbi:MAG: hypothetical protein OXC68_07715 [Aestuariivita sp.]|nr:hypothetical protein [Aestuariivita sp.]
MLIVIGLALAGCGGSSDDPGNDTDMTDKPDPTPVACGGGLTAATSAGCKAALDAANATEAAAKKKTDDAKNLKTALGKAGDTNALSVGATTTLDVDRTDTQSPAIALITLKKQSTTITPLGGWTGVDYKGDEGTTPNKNTGEARLYTNQGAGKVVSFAEGSGLTAKTEEGNVGTYTIPAGADTDIAGFPSVGTQNYEDDAEVKGTFKGVSGTYTYNADDCTSTPNTEGGFTLAAGTAWSFKPNAGATLRDTASDYLYFGWWVRKDKDGKPTHIRATYGDNNPGTDAEDLQPVDATTSGLIGEATYNGKAAGKYAVSDPLTLSGMIPVISPQTPC